MVYQPGPNDLLRVARLASRSPSGSGRPMSRQELAESVNAWLYEHTGRRTAIASRYIGVLERGDTRWPSAHYRMALRAVLGKATDVELGFFIIQGHAKDPDRSMVAPAPTAGPLDAASAGFYPASSSAVDTGPRTAAGGLAVASTGAVAVRVSVSVAGASVAGQEGLPGCITLVAGPLRVLIDVSSDVPTGGAAAVAGAAVAAGGARVYSLAERRAR
ncbi:hypothetical protein [Micromonospora maritima]|uniref:hypothetical protein n=1 Tax=Micromonospora maritima TaxID=986711 RepID=UPI0037985526